MSKKKSLFSEATEAKSLDPIKEMPRRLVIREADNGFIVSDDSYMGKEHIYTSIDELKKCLDEKFGKAKKG